MNTTLDDNGQTRLAIGAPGSLERVKVEHCALIERLSAMHNATLDRSEAIAEIRHAGITSPLKTESLLMASGYGSPRGQFLEAYREELANALRDYPEEYAWPASQLDAVWLKMSTAIVGGTFNKDSRAIKAVCKRLGIGHTYRDIKAYLNL